MNIELMIETNRVHPLIVSFDDIAYGCDSDGMLSIAQKEFISVGQFRYNWLIQYMDANEVRSLIDALQFALKHLPDDALPKGSD